MKKIFYSALCVAALATTSCSEFLETSSPSVVDGDFVFSNMTTARAAMDGTYEAFRDAIQNDLFGDGFYYAMDVTGSDIERHPESYTAQLPRHEPECFYVNGTVTGSYVATGYQKESPSNGYARSFNTISKANAVISAMEAMPGFEEQIAAGQPTDILNLYGEAIAIRATCYRELIKYYGDVPYNDTFGEPAGGLVGRDSIFEACLADLQRVEPIMYRLGEKGTDASQITRTYVQGLIGRMALEAGGYHTRRSDITYHDIDGNVISFEQKGKVNASADNAVYNRRTDYKKFYEIAKTYFGKVLENPGTAKFHLTDPRKNEAARQYNNPYQYFFEQMHETKAETLADESIYEIVMTMGSGNDARPYSFGRPSAGGSKLTTKAGMPCKNYGQGRINPAFYYGMFDPNDMRRDVSIAVTGSKGDGSEKLLPMAPGSQSNGGGLSLNKWDENRQDMPYSAQRKSGINAPYMRMAEVYLGYAEACAVTGDEATAKQYLKIVRERSFPAGKANTDAFIASRASLVEAIIDERGFEYAGEGDRRYTLIRSGFIGEKIKAVKELTKAMIEGLKANGYYEFENGNVISDYVYTKLVDGNAVLGYRLTAQASETQLADPAKKELVYPSWRGQHDNWESVCAAGGFTYTGATKTNLAIQGLFEKVDGAALEAAGYTKEEWGKALVANEEDYYNKFFNGYDFETAPVYTWPFTPNVVATGGFLNGYGFMN
ncbi:MAG: RagB/SusD family nutrient uptake outer membrane protein [Rikenellaceae bacterium]|nr:RagB/SusD family nutrient uptake outer membrane protein [Rikenellaceae bacterium]